MHTLDGSAARIPRQAGRLAIVTGASAGLGYATALGLAKAGADVVVAAEDEIEGLRAVGQIRPLAPAALVRFEKLDVGSLASVAGFAARMAAAGRSVDLLINHAHVPVSAERQVTADGFEGQMGGNYLGHFALTARLLPLLLRSRRPRVVQVSSLCHRDGHIHFGDLHLERDYDPWAAHCQSMLALLLFAHELQRRSDAQGWSLVSAAAHPGNVRPQLLANGFGPRSLVRRLHGSPRWLVSHSAEEGALPALYAAMAPDVSKGAFYTPDGPFELVGSPESAKPGRRASDPEVARRLWQVSEELTQVKWPWSSSSRQ
jgi:NAD(P)-dependent dehydrogenase (short-subunit alcohol dehydrogenase family)